MPGVENAFRLRLVTVTTNVTNYHIITEFNVNSTPMPDGGDPDEPEPTGTNINTSISAGSQVSILIKNEDGNVVRTLVNNEYRELGSYVDYWDCKGDNGIVANDGVYYAVMQYIVDGQVQTFDLTTISGGTRYDFPISSGCNTRSGSWTENFSPFDDERIVFYPDGSMYYYDSGGMVWGNYQITELNSREIVIWSSFEGEDEITTLSEGGYVWDSNGDMVEGFRWYVE